MKTDPYLTQVVRLEASPIKRQRHYLTGLTGPSFIGVERCYFARQQRTQSVNHFVLGRKLVAGILIGILAHTGAMAAQTTIQRQETDSLWPKLLLLLVGGVLAFLGRLLATHFYPTIRNRWRLWLLRRRPNVQIPPVEVLRGAKLSVGKLTVRYVVLATGTFTKERIRCIYDDRPFRLPSDLERIRMDYLKEWKSRDESGEIRLPYNSPGYKLKEFDVLGREIIDGEEVPFLRLNFGPTDYFTQLVTDLNVGNPTRDRYAALTDCTLQPIPEFSSILGVNLVLVTRDNRLVVTKRNPFVHSGPGKLHCSVAENLLRPTDAGPDQAPDPFRTALRGAQEELGIVLAAENLEFIAFGVEPVLCQYTLTGWCQINATAKELEAIRAFGVPKDKWENQKLIFLPCHLTSIANFIMQDRDHWDSFGLAAIILSLPRMGFSNKEIVEAFSD